MAYPQYERVCSGGFSPLENTTYASPVTYQEPFHPHDSDGYFDHGDLGAGIEMDQQRAYGLAEHTRSVSIAMTPMPYTTGATSPDSQRKNERMYSTSSTVFPNNEDGQSFLVDPINHIDTFHMTNSFRPLDDNTGKQLRHIFIASTSRFLVTAGLCGGYILATREWQKKGAVSEAAKKEFNTITTAISIALGLNIASAFKDMALNMRWPILHGKKRSLVELDLLLSADSLTRLAKLALVAKRPVVVIACISWLFINLLAQAGIAMISLTYGFDPCYFDLQFNQGDVSIPNLNHFYPAGSASVEQVNGTVIVPSIQDEEYVAHGYGQAVYNYGVDTIDNFPKPGAIYQPYAAMLYWSNNTENLIKLRFSDSPTDQYLGTYSVYSERTINVTFACESHKVTAGGNGTLNSIVVDGIGTVEVVPVPDSTTYFTNLHHVCKSGSRCSVVEAFESSSTDPWYYKCNITMGSTLNDKQNLSKISDYMAQIATASIAQVGYTNYKGQASQIYPRNSPWGVINSGDASAIGMIASLFALGTIAGATIRSPLRSYSGLAPSGGVYLHVGHPRFFYLILGLIIGCHLVFMIVVAILANRVMVGPDGHLSMSLLLKPIADALNGVSGGVENKAFRDAKRTTNVKYEKEARSGRWVLNMVDR